MFRLVVLGFVVVSTLSVAVAYDFDDPVFNQVLARDLEDVYTSSFSSPRVRRDTATDAQKCVPLHRGPPKLCCADDVIKKMHDDEKDIKRDCFKEITGKDKPDKPGPPRKLFDLDPFDCEAAQKRREEMLCIFQCVGQKKNLIDDKGNLKEDAITKHVKDLLSQATYLSPAQDEIIKTCINEAKNITSIREAQKEKCNPAETKLNQCLFKQIQLSCPADQIKDQQACTFLQDRLKSGKDDMPPPHPGH